MGKTKTSFVEEGAEVKSSEQAYKEKKERQAKEAAEKAAGAPVKVPGLKGGQKIKVVEEAPVETENSTETPVETNEGSKKAVEPKVRSKKYQEAKAKVGLGKSFKLSEALKLAQETSYSKFDGTIELHFVVKKVGTSAKVTLPYPFGEEKKVEIATDETIKKLAAGKIDFDVLLATPDFMPKLVPFARLLGPRGMMPNPKNGTLIPDVSKASKFSASDLNIKTEKEAPLIHTAVGKVSSKVEELEKNAQTIMNALGGDKQILRAFTKASMGPSVRIDIRS